MTVHVLPVFIFMNYDWICCDGTEGVCMYVCVCMCVTALKPKRMDRFWWNFLQMIWQIFARSLLLGFWNFEIDDVMAAILHFFSGALSRSQFCFDFLQNWGQGTKLSSNVCYWKSAKSFGNFRKYREPRFRKKSKWPPKHFLGNRASKVSISTNSDPLITNLIMFCRFD